MGCGRSVLFISSGFLLVLLSVINKKLVSLKIGKNFKENRSCLLKVKQHSSHRYTVLQFSTPDLVPWDFLAVEVVPQPEPEPFKVYQEKCLVCTLRRTNKH